MKIDQNKSQGRVNEKKFVEIPLEHRNTLIVGMSDMVECLAKYLDSKTLAAFQPILEYQRWLVSEDLRREFDSYLANESCPTCAIASSFISFLIAKSGADRKMSK